MEEIQIKRIKIKKVRGRKDRKEKILNYWISRY